MFTDMRSDPGTLPTGHHYDEIIDEVRFADHRGFSHVWTTEQHGVDDGYLPTHFPPLAAFARETRKIRLGTGVILLPLAQARRVVEEACVVDVLSHGRLTVGVAAGHYPHEFTAFGVDRKRRGAILEENLRFIRPGLSGDPLPDGLPVNVMPAQQSIPLIVGGLAPAAVERAVRLGDGYFGYAYVDPDDEFLNLWDARIAPALESYERSPEDFRLIMTTVMWVSEHAEDDWRKVVGPAFLYQQQKYAEWERGQGTAGGYLDGSNDLDQLRQRMLVGGVEEIADRINRIREKFPFHELVFWPRLPGVPHGMAMEGIDRVAGELLPRLQGESATNNDGGRGS